ncbi:dTMP kinase [Streptomyces rubiginosohelvolus]|uniref:dTMP kinase n=1 Tax=Streptomyces rubiginosohelvolus TaxID=67362 RepID=UPI003690C66C
MNGLFALCGLPGSGKSTLADALSLALTAVGRPCQVITPLQANSALVRRISRLPSPSDPLWPERERWMSDYFALRLLEAAELEIAPALGAGRWVITDRWVPDQIVNQTFFGVEPVTQQPALAQLPRPALTVLLDVDVETALRRNEGRQRSAGPFALRRDFLEHARQAYRKMASADTTLLSLDGTAPAHRNVELILQHLEVS